MSRVTPALVVTVLTMAIAVAGCGGGGDDVPAISQARIGEPTGPNAALYFVAGGYGTDDRLVAASTDVAPRVEIHETTMNDDGTMGMSPVEGLDIPAQGDLVFEPGGYHVMLIDVDRLEVGETVDVVLEWEHAGSQTIEAEVVDPADTMTGMGDEMGDDG